jgi:hypothetical protein
MVAELIKYLATVAMDYNRGKTLRSPKERLSKEVDMTRMPWLFRWPGYRSSHSRPRVQRRLPGRHR